MKKKSRTALRISNIVYGRATARSRVTYLVDPHGGGTERAIPERVVLRRWRSRRRTGVTFSGERLSPTVWRAISATFGSDINRWISADVDAIGDVRTAKLSDLRARRLSSPSPDTLHALFQACGIETIKALIKRHASPAHHGRSGVPDLFLYATDMEGKISSYRFVEVKKPAEPVSKDQIDEISFMQSLGLRVRVLRLIER